MNRDAMAHVIGQLKELSLTVTDEWGHDVATETPAHDPTAAFPYRIREHPMRFLGMITDEAIILFPRGYETIPQHLLVGWAIAGILRPHRPEQPTIEPIDDSEF